MMGGESIAPWLRVGVAILTVIPVELEAARAALGLRDDARETGPDGTVYYRGSVSSALTRRDVSVVLSCIAGAGNPGAAAATANVIERYAPHAVLLTGIAAGVRGKVRIGDVVIAERVVAYEPAALVRTAAGATVQPRPEIDRVLTASRIRRNLTLPIERSTAGRGGRKVRQVERQR